MINDVIIAIIIGYLLGSIPFALVVGKVFFNTDVRQHGSGNLGGTNTGRVLGKKAGLAVIILDVCKVILAMFLTTFLKNSEIAGVWAGVAAAIGHCYPIFAKFKGGKAVATMGGFLIGAAIFVLQDPYIILVPLAVFLLILGIFQMVSLASICGATVAAIYSIFRYEPMIYIACILLAILVIYRHRSNIVKIKNGEESKITWLPWSKK